VENGGAVPPVHHMNSLRGAFKYIIKYGGKFYWHLYRGNVEIIGTDSMYKISVIVHSASEGQSTQPPTLSVHQVVTETSLCLTVK
jgi:hypothetical protein